MIRSPPHSKAMSTSTRSARHERRLLAKNELVLQQSRTTPAEEKPKEARVASDVKSEVQRISVDRHSAKASSASSVTAQKKRLELEAAQEKARIQMELIDKRLAADIAALDDQYSPGPSRSDGNSGEDVKKWLEQSQQHLETQRDTNGITKGSLRHPPPDPDGTDGPVQQLVSAMKELVSASTSANNNGHLLSRISTPRDLPMFYGDPMEWLAFKQAYEESTTLCHFTEKENIWRLRRCLRGPAKEAVSALIITATSPTVVMATLELQFGNPEVIITKIISDMKKVTPLPHDYYKEIVTFSIRVQNCVAAVRALNREEYLQGVSVANIILSKLPTVLLAKWTDYSYPHIIAGGKTRMEILSEFLSDEALKISTCNAQLLHIKTDRRKYNENHHPRTQTVLVQSIEKSTDEKCRFCRVSKHKLPDCKKFKKSLRKDRWAYVKRAGICYKCLSSRHDRLTCPAAACDVDSCGESHHRLLHFVPSSPRVGTADVQVIDRVRDNDSESASQSNRDTGLVTHIKSNDCSVLLQVVKVNIHGPNGLISAIALLDSGSTVTLISAALAARAQLRGRKRALHVRGAWDNTGLTCETEQVDLTLSNTYGTIYTISARSINELDLPVQNLPNVSYDNYTYLRGLRDELCTGRLKPEILIGQDNYHLMLPLETVAGNPHEPCATRTPLGWCLHGRVMASSSTYHSTLCITDDEAAGTLNDLHEEVRRSFSIDAMGVSSAKPRQNSEDQRAWNYLEATSSLVDGKWHVGLPWKDVNCVMPDSYSHALARLKGVEIKMKKSKDYATKYQERVQHLLDNDYAEELKEGKVTPKTWYLPHFGLGNPNKNIRFPRHFASATTRASETDSQAPTTEPPSPLHKRERATPIATKPLRGLVTAASIPSATPCSMQTLQTGSAPAHVTSGKETHSCYKNLQLHIFCDASTQAFCAVANWPADEIGNASGQNSDSRRVLLSSTGVGRVNDAFRQRAEGGARGGLRQRPARARGRTAGR